VTERKSRTARDAGLRRVGTITKWIAGVAVGLTGFITVWEVQSAHHVGATTPAVTQTPSTSRKSDPSATQPAAPGPGSSSGLQAPDTAPHPTDRQPAATSGGS
jgi:hypothetical protein